MTAVELLNRCRETGPKIRAMEAVLDQLRESASAVSVNLDPNGGSRGGSGEQDRLGRFACEIADQSEALDALRKRWSADMLACVKVLVRLSDVQNAVLYRYYVEGLSVGKVSIVLGYSVGYVKRVKKSGLDALEGVEADDVNA